MGEVGLMIERVARALFTFDGLEDWDLVTDLDLLEAYRNTARAAIAAMREPTEGMVLEGAKAAADQMYYKDNAWERCVIEEAKQDRLNASKYGWYAAIDEALR